VVQLRPLEDQTHTGRATEVTRYNPASRREETVVLPMPCRAQRDYEPVEPK
jgi:hypothetical protein